MKITRLAGVLAVTTTLALAPSVANAETKSHLDATRDVAGFTLGDDEENDPSTDAVPFPDRAEGDIRSIRVTHLDNTVRIKLGLRALSRNGLVKSATYYLRTDKGARLLMIHATRGSWRGRSMMMDGHADEVTCGELSHKLDYANDKVVVVIPRSCLNDPRWVRAAASFTTGEETPEGDLALYFDDARRNSGSFASRPAYGPRVHRS